MRPRALRRRLGLVLAGLGLVSLVACGSDPFGPPSDAVRPLLFEYFIHPRFVGPGIAATVRAGALVGPDLCWEVGAAAIRQSGDTLYLEGTARFVPRGGACPTALAYDSLEVTIPPLAPGRYFLVAGDLVDTLYAGYRAGPEIIGGAFAAHGRIWLSEIPEACPTFECRFAGFRAVAGFVDNPPVLPPGGVAGRATGDLLGEVMCFTGERGQRLQLRGFEPGPSSGQTRRPGGHRLSRGPRLPPDG